MPEVKDKQTKDKYQLNNYSKWDNIHVSDDEDDTHPNVDTPSLFRWRHKARVEREEELKKRRFQIDKDGDKLKQQIRKAKDDGKKKELEKKLEQWKLDENKLAKDEKEEPWNVDTMSKDKESRTIINKPKAMEDLSKLSDDERADLYKKFVSENEDKVKQYSMYTQMRDAEQFLKSNPHLACEFTANYLCIFSIDLAQEKKFSLFEIVSHQAICMQFILELAKGLKRHPAETFPAFFKRYTEGKDTKEGKEYHKAFNDELTLFRQRAKDRALQRDKEIEEAALQEAAEEEERDRQKRIEASPSGLDPQDVFENSPEEMQNCYIEQDVPKLTNLVNENPETYMEHMKNWILCGLWIPSPDSPLYYLVEEGKKAKEAALKEQAERKEAEDKAKAEEERKKKEAEKNKSSVLDELD